MADVSSRNTYALLGNDPEQDSDREPEPPVKVVDRPTDRRGKRNGPHTAPNEARGGSTRGGRKGPGGNEGGEHHVPKQAQGNHIKAAFRDREAGSAQNRGKPTEEKETTRGGNSGRGDRVGRQGRGGKGPRDDRHNRGNPNEHQKQADQSWGAPTGDSEWQDEQLGAQAARMEANNEATDAAWDAGANIGDGGQWGANGDGIAPANGGPSTVDPAKALEPEPTPQDNSKSYADYLAEQAEKKLNLGTAGMTARKPNEGAKVAKEWENAKPMAKPASTDFMSGLGKGDKAPRERVRKDKQTLEVDFRFAEPSNGRSERGGRGGRGRAGEGRGDRSRGGRGGRGEGGHRGGRGGHRVNVEGGQVNVEDQSAFPSLGGS